MEQKNFFQKNYSSVPFTIFFMIFLFLAFKVAAPIFTPVLWAAFFSFLAYPIYSLLNKKLFHNNYPNTSAAFAMLILLIICIVPIVYSLSSLAKEASGMGIYFSSKVLPIKTQAKDFINLTLPDFIPKFIATPIESFLHNSDAMLSLIQNATNWGAQFLSKLSSRIIEHASALVMNFFIALMFTFFFIRDRAVIISYIKILTPLEPEEKEKFYSHTRDVLNSVVYGSLLTVAVQAFIGGICWWFAGLDDPTLFGTLMLFAGMLPAGTAVVWVPGSIYLACIGDIKNAAILFALGTLVIGSIDNFMRPVIISSTGGGNEIPTLLILMGIFGGVYSFGFIGIFAGPTILALFKCICDIYCERCSRYSSVN